MALPLTILVYDGLSMLEFGAAVDIFRGHASNDAPWYQVTIASVDGPTVTTQAGVALTSQAGREALLTSHTIVIPGWRQLAQRPDAELLDLLRQAHAQGCRLVSFCSGAFLLGYTGLLDGRSATTHWKYATLFAQLFPAVQLQVGDLYVADQLLWSSAGSAACLDLSLQLIRHDFGAARANQSARRLVIPGVRSGGQQQYIELPMPRERCQLGPVQDYVKAHLAEPLSVTELASYAHMSRRSFDRHFKASFGISAKQWLLQARIDHAKQLLASSTLTIEQIAHSCGFQSGQALRDQFVVMVGLAPSHYRQQQFVD